MTNEPGRFAALAMTMLALGGLTGCDWDKKAAAPKASEAAAAPDLAPTPTPAPAASAGRAAAPGARPAYADLFPGAHPIDASGPTPSGGAGLVTFTTEASPSDVVSFYRTRAEQAGLTQVAAMDQGAARAYGAEDKVSGDTLQVIASPETDGSTTVQLSWTAG